MPEKSGVSRDILKGHILNSFAKKRKKKKFSFYYDYYFKFNNLILIKQLRDIYKVYNLKVGIHNYF